MIGLTDYLRWSTDDRHSQLLAEAQLARLAATTRDDTAVQRPFEPSERTFASREVVVRLAPTPASVERAASATACDAPCVEVGAAA